MTHLLDHPRLHQRMEYGGVGEPQAEAPDETLRGDVLLAHEVFLSVPMKTGGRPSAPRLLSASLRRHCGRIASPARRRRADCFEALLLTGGDDESAASFGGADRGVDASLGVSCGVGLDNAPSGRKRRHYRSLDSGEHLLRRNASPEQ